MRAFVVLIIALILCVSAAQAGYVSHRNETLPDGLSCELSEVTQEVLRFFQYLFRDDSNDVDLAFLMTFLNMNGISLNSQSRSASEERAITGSFSTQTWTTSDSTIQISVASENRDTAGSLTVGSNTLNYPDNTVLQTLTLSTNGAASGTYTLQLRVLPPSDVLPSSPITSGSLTPSGSYVALSDQGGAYNIAIPPTTDVASQVLGISAQVDPSNSAQFLVSLTITNVPSTGTTTVSYVTFVSDSTSDDTGNIVNPSSSSDDSDSSNLGAILGGILGGLGGAIGIPILLILACLALLVVLIVIVLVVIIVVVAIALVVVVVLMVLKMGPFGGGGGAVSKNSQIWWDDTDYEDEEEDDDEEDDDEDSESDIESSDF